MATTVPAMKARLGNTDYYILSMKARELVHRVTIPKELPEWENMSLEERYQRDIDFSRVRTQIAPYLANDDSRFFGAFIVTAINFEEAVSFEPLTEVIPKGVPQRYRPDVSGMGFLTFTDGEVFVPLDGQHRLKAIDFAINARDQNSKEIPNISPCNDLAKEDVTVILVPYEKEKARKIFTRVNKYARKTTTGQNIVTDDDDIAAVLTREIVNKLISGRLAKYSSSTLNTKEPQFTTLSTIYNCNIEIIQQTYDLKLDTKQLPDNDKQRLYRSKVQEIWEALLDGIDVFADALSDREETGDEKRQEIRRTNLLGKPVGQECLVRAFLRLTGVPTNMGYQEACERLNALPWGITEENIEKVWQGVLWRGGASNGRIITMQRNRKLAIMIIAYLAGEKLDEEQKSNLLQDYLMEFTDSELEGKTLPELP